nr:metallophosphoesterase family protein [uncultured Flavobacterium sp.]
MKVGVISDIHGNNYALREVLKVAKQEGVEKLLVLGDIVGYYYHPEIVLEMLSDWDYEIIKGNHEELLQELYENRIDSNLLRQKYGKGHDEALKNLDEKTLKWLFSLPVQKTIIIDDVCFQLNHGSPRKIDDYIYPDTIVEKLEDCNSEFHDFVLIGHSHYSFSYNCKNSILINCGSVGQSRQKGGVAYWAMIDTYDKSYNIKLVPYDTRELIDELKLNDPNSNYAINILGR